MNTDQPTPPPDKPQGAETIAETPRTDANLIDCGYEVGNRVEENWRVEADFARSLERELTAKTSELVAATEALEKAKAELDDEEKRSTLCAQSYVLMKSARDTWMSDYQVLRDQFNVNTIALQQSGKREAALREALERLTYLIDNAGTMNLSRGVQLGAMSWLIKLNDAMTDARAALSQQAPTNDTQGCTP